MGRRGSERPWWVGPSLALEGEEEKKEEEGEGEGIIWAPVAVLPTDHYGVTYLEW